MLRKLTLLLALALLLTAAAPAAASERPSLMDARAAASENAASENAAAESFSAALPEPSAEALPEPTSADPEEVLTGGDAAAAVARTYYLAAESGREDFAYGNDSFFEDTTGEGKNIDCSQYISLVLRGVAYQDSPYVLQENTIRDTNRPGWAGELLDGHERISTEYPPEAADLRTLTYYKNYRNSYAFAIRQFPWECWPTYAVRGGRLCYPDPETPYVRAWQGYLDRTGVFGFSVKMSADLAECFYYPALAGDGEVVWMNPRRFVRTLHRAGGLMLKATDECVNEEEFRANRCPDGLLQPGDLLFFAGTSDSFSNKESHDRFLSITHVGIISEDPAYYYEVTTAGKVVNRTRIGKNGFGGVLVLRPGFYSEISVPRTVLFCDVPSDGPEAELVDWALRTGIAKGVSEGCFGLETACTRGAALTFLWRAAGCPETAGEQPFSDVKESAYCAEAAKWAASLGLVRAGEQALLRPEAPCSRGELALLLWRLAGAPGEAPDPAAYPTFPDVTASSPYAAAVEWLAASGLAGDPLPLFYRPNQPASRLEVLRLIRRIARNDSE